MWSRTPAFCRCVGAPQDTREPPVRPVACAAMEHRFTGPSYTLGIEEELMIVDSETLELQNSIEAMLEALPQAEAQIKPELMESVLEVATTPCRTTREAGGAAARPPPPPP